MKKGWATKTLGDVLQKTETVNPLRSPHAEFDYIDVSSISNATFQIKATHRLKGKDAPSRARKLVRANDILFATIRPTLQRIAIVPKHLDQQVCSTGYFVLRAMPGIDPRFVFYSLFTEKFTEQMRSLQKGASYPAVTDGDVKAQAIPVPPLPEQHRIVGLLDEAFAGIASARTNAEKNLQSARALFKSHVNSIFLPSGEGWPVKRLGDLTDLITKGTTPTSVGHGFVPTGINFIKIEAISGDGHFIKAKLAQITQGCHKALRRSQLKSGDIFFSIAGALGRTAFVTEDIIPANTNQALAIIRLKNSDDVAPEFVLQALSTGAVL
jgi:restriction endonuclease S subunit